MSSLYTILTLAFWPSPRVWPFFPLYCFHTELTMNKVGSVALSADNLASRTRLQSLSSAVRGSRPLVHSTAAPSPLQSCGAWHRLPAPCAASAAMPSDGSEPSAASTSGTSAESARPAGSLARLKSFVLGSSGKLDRQRLAELGFGAFSAYGVISNVNAAILITIAWLTIVRTQHATPLAPGMWPKFLAVYAGLWVSSHFLRPFRLSLAIAAAPAFDAALNSIMKRTGFNKVGAFIVMLPAIALGTFALLGTLLLVFGGFSV